MARNPLTAVPATRSSLPLLKIRRRLVLGFLAASVASGVFSTFVVLSHGSTKTTDVELPDQSAIALAQTAVEDFLAARDSTVPVAADVRNDFSTDADNHPAKAMAYESLTFAGSTPSLPIGDSHSEPAVAPVLEKFLATVVLPGPDKTPQRHLYSITVPMVKTDLGWEMAAAPALAPEVAAPSGQAGLDYKELFPTKNAIDANTLESGYKDYISQWATTFAAAGPADEQLAAFTGDQSDNTYSGLNGWTLVGPVTFKSAVPIASPFPGYIVRVGLVLRSPASNGPTLSTDYDLLVRSDQSQSRPPVVAWGPAGSYWQLEPYFNADR